MSMPTHSAAPPMFAGRAAFAAALAGLPVPDGAALEAARGRQASLTKPAGSLGRLEEIAVFMAGWQGREIPQAERIQAVIFAGNHGVAARGVSAYPPEVTRQMVANFENGGAAINALTAACGAARAHHVHPLLLRGRQHALVATAPNRILFGADRLAHLGRAIGFEPGARLAPEALEFRRFRDGRRTG